MSTQHLSQPDEVWRTVPSHPRYEASNRGQVRTLAKNVIRLMKQRVNVRTGYCQVDLSVGEKGKKRTQTVTVHRLVADAFLGPLVSPQVVNHRDGCRTNNNVGNLEIVGQGLNILHRDLFEWVRLAVRMELQEMLRPLLPPDG